MLAWPLVERRDVLRLVSMGLLWLLLVLTVVGIPIASLSLTGWMLKAVDNLRERRLELPPPGFHLRRGAALFTVQVAYLLALLLVSGLAVAAGVRLGGVGGGLLAVFGESLFTLGSTLLVALTPVLTLLTEDGGAAAGLNARRLLALLDRNRRLAVGSGLLSLLCLDIISPIGLLACGVGLAVSAAYAYAVLASTIVAYDRQLRR
ncbi:MAG TPA: DUF4013 domain-containing protein [Candidatus Dormibacteraeota bacterium]|nr:DUF4013 domain-containing protein [Candidatus Dormibacteraeota bacterium]